MAPNVINEQKTAEKAAWARRSAVLAARLAP